MSDLDKTALHDLHLRLGAKMVPFAGYNMPVQYPVGVMQEHLHTRKSAGLFDVSHMGQVILRGSNAAAELEKLVPVDIQGLKQGRQRYGYFTNQEGGILDDLMIANRGDHLFVVVNAACKNSDIAHMRTNLACDVEVVRDRSLLALQGPMAETAMKVFVPEIISMKFMDVGIFPSQYGELWISRSGYSGEDGFEISVLDENATALAEALLDLGFVLPIGLGARDSLRLEAGLCLYGNDIDGNTTPVEADLQWAIQKVRREGGERAGGFPGADKILKQLDNGVMRRRIGLLPEGRAPMRAGTQLFASETSEQSIGNITSGAFGPTIEQPMSMGYLDYAYSNPGTVIYGDVRGKRLPAKVITMPFTPANFKR